MAENEKNKKTVNETEEKEQTGSENKTSEGMKDEDASDIEKGKYIFKRPFEFEGNEIKEIDISGLDEIRGKDISAVLSQLRQRGVSTGGMDIYDSTDFLFALAARKTGVPVELFGAVYSYDYLVLSRVIANFLLKMA